MPVCKKCKGNHPEFVVNKVEWKCDYTAKDIHNIHNKTLKDTVKQYYKNIKKDREEWVERVSEMRHRYINGGIFYE